MTKISSFEWNPLSSVPPFPGPPKTKTGQASKKLIFGLEKMCSVQNFSHDCDQIPMSEIFKPETG